MESRFFTLRNTAALSSLTSAPSVPWFSWQTNASASAKTLSSRGQCLPRCLMSFDELSKIFKADCLTVSVSWLYYNQWWYGRLAATSSSPRSLRSCELECIFLSGCTGEHPDFLTEILSVRQKEDENICVTAQHVNFLITPNSCLSSVE